MTHLARNQIEAWREMITGVPFLPFGSESPIRSTATIELSVVTANVSAIPQINSGSMTGYVGRLGAERITNAGML